MDNTFGGRLKSIRLGMGLSQDAFAGLLGTSKQVISRYETNQRVPKLTVADAYARTLDVSLDYLLSNSGEASGEKQPAVVQHGGQSTVEQDFLSLLHRVPESQLPMLYAMIEAALKAQGLI